MPLVTPVVGAVPLNVNVGVAEPDDVGAPDPSSFVQSTGLKAPILFSYDVGIKKGYSIKL
jgi:hypothetical protein